MPKRTEPQTSVRSTTVLLHDFKTNVRRLLPADHPLLVIIARVPDELQTEEFAARAPDWLALLEG